MDEDDDIFIDVVPRVDEGALQRVEDRIKGTGKVISDVLGEDLTNKVKDALGDIAGRYATEIGSKIGDAIGSGVGKIGDKIGVDLSGIGDALGDAVRNWSDVKDQMKGTASSFADAFHELQGGDLEKALGGLEGSLGKLDSALSNFGLKVPESINNALGGAQDWTDNLKKIQEQVQGTQDTFNTFGGFAEGLGIGGAAKFGLKAGEAVGPIAGAYALVDPAQRFLTQHGIAKDDGIDWGYDFLHPWDVLGRLPGMGWTPFSHDRDILGRNRQADADRRAAEMAAAQLPHGTGADTGAGALNMDVPALTRGGGGAGATGAINMPSSVITTRSAEISAVNVNINGSHVSGGGSSGSVGAVGGAGGSAGPAATQTAGGSRGSGSIGSVGAVTIPHRDTGGVVPGDAPGYDNQLGQLPGGGLVGLEGGEGIVNDDAMAQPGVPDLVANLNTHYAGGTTTKQGVGGGTEVGNGEKTPTNFSSGPGDSQHGAPQFTSPGPGNGTGDEDGDQRGGFNIGGGSTPNIPKSSKQTPKERIPTGKGQGFSVTGGGIIGAAESAASMAAGMESFGGGSVGAQVAFQEINRAAGYLGQVIPTLAVEAPLDTFWLSDSGLSDPSHSWFGKLGLSLVGEHLNSKNVAGATKAPLQSPADKARAGGSDGGQFPAVHIENQYNASDVDHHQNNLDLATQMGAHSNTPTPYTPPSNRSPVASLMGGEF